MIIISFFDGLGNQMFHYAFYRAMRHFRKDVKADIQSIWNPRRCAHNGYELNKIFKLNIEFATIKDREEMIGNISFDPYDIMDRIKRKISFLLPDKLYVNKSFQLYTNRTFQEALTFNKEYFEFTNKYMQAHYQTERYFKDIEDIIRNDFRFDNEYSEENAEIISDIQKNNSVSVHVRRGDYNKDKFLGDVCTVNYYKNAIQEIIKTVDNPHWYIFSNDINWCKEQFNMDNVIFVNINHGKDSFRDMQLMSLCKHNIIANSTFSWWGAWLNSNQHKIVIAPDHWINGASGTFDIIPNDWIKCSS